MWLWREPQPIIMPFLGKERDMKDMEKKKGLSLTARQNLVGYSFILPNFIGFFIFIFV